MTGMLERTTTISVDAAALKVATAWVSRALPARAPHPALSGILLNATEEGALSLTAWDWTTLCSATIDAATIDAASIDANSGTAGPLGIVLVNGSLLTDVSARLAGNVTLDIDGTELQARSGAGRSRYRLRLMPADEYPHYRPAPTAVGTAKRLGEALARVAYAAATDPPAGTNLDVVSAQAKDGALKLFATDKYRMALTEVPWDGPDLQFAVNAKRLAELTRALGDRDIRIGLDPDRVAFHAGARTAVLSQVGGQYLTVEKSRSFFERNWQDGYADLDRPELLDALADVSPTAEREQHAAGTVTLAFTRGEVGVASRSAEKGDGASAAACHLDGPDRLELFDLALLTQTLKAIPENQIRISFAPRAGLPTLFSPVVESRIDLANSHVVMPKRARKACPG